MLETLQNIIIINVKHDLSFLEILCQGEGRGKRDEQEVCGRGERRHERLRLLLDPCGRRDLERLRAHARRHQEHGGQSGWGHMPFGQGSIFSKLSGFQNGN